jgi:hypothetical protein
MQRKKVYAITDITAVAEQLARLIDHMLGFSGGCAYGIDCA